MEHDIGQQLKEAKTIAVVGCSDKPYRTSHQIARYLQEQGYRIVPVHPDYDSVLGEKVYRSVPEIPEEIGVDIVNIFRAPEYTLEMVEDACTYGEKTGRKPLVWTQLGVSSEPARKRAEEAGLPYVVDKCIMVEHRKWFS